MLDECAADLRRPQTTRRLESDPVVPNRSFEEMPEGEMPCEMKRPSDTFERRLPLHIVPKSNGPDAARIWCGGVATDIAQEGPEFGVDLNFAAQAMLDLIHFFEVWSYIRRKL